MKSFEYIKRKILDYKKGRQRDNILISDEQVEFIANIFDSSEALSKFNMKNIIIEGIGGNGIVFKYTCDNNVKCIKCLYNKRKRIIQNNEKKFIGEERFKNEIKAMNELSNIDGVMPIIFDGLKEEKLPYYIMPFYKCYKNKLEEYGFKERILQMIRLANIIKSIHSIKDLDSHRDIKLDNIFEEKGNIYLSDFGLVKFEDDKFNFTKYENHIGPNNISPPEFYSEKLRKEMNYSYQISDVYLFSKVVWQVLMKDPHGFWGSYVNNRDCFIDVDVIRGKYQMLENIFIEPINEMIVNTTSDNISHRQKYNIDYCISCLERELKLIEEMDKIQISLSDYRDKINHLMFFQRSNQTAISFDNEQAIGLIISIIKSKDSKKIIESYKKTNRKTIKIDEVELQYSNEIFTIYLYEGKNIKYEFCGKINYCLVDNEKKEILIRFDNVNNKSYVSTYKDMSKYGTETIKEGFLEEQNVTQKYLLDKDCELLVTFNGEYLNY